jgi:signal transduction histidine kinase
LKGNILADHAPLPHFKSHQEFSSYNLLSTLVWVYKIDENAFWWANNAALAFWETDSVDAFVSIDLTEDTPVVKDRLNDVFERCATGETVEENWTLYPKDIPKMVFVTFHAIFVEKNKRAVLIEATPFLKDELDPRAKRILEAARNTPLLVSTYNLDGHLLVQNPAAVKAYGISTDQIVAFSDRYPDIDLTSELNKSLKQHSIFVKEVEVLTQQAPRWHRITVEKGRDPVSGEQVYVVAEEDVTKRIQAEQDLKNLNLTLEQRVAERTEKLSIAQAEAEAANQAKTDFLATMSHELRTPLNAIIGFSEMLSARVYGSINDRQASALSDINDSGRRLLNQINELLDASTIDSGNLNLFETTFPVSKITDYCERVFSLEASKKGQRLVIECRNADTVICADEHRLTQVIINLMTNATKYTPKGGQISLIIYKKENGDVVFEIHDNGIGIEESELKRVFDAFMQAEQASTLASGKGVGLGLYISSQLMKLHNGSIHMSSQVGKGTVATATLPASRVIA